MTEWIDIKEVNKIIDLMRSNEWKWMFNPTCKYITLRIDMRDGHCIIHNRDNNEITIDKLRAQ